MGSQAAASQTSSGLPYYVWDAPGKGVLIHLHFDVIDRILPEVMRGFGALPRRGAEVGGILLGRVEESGERIVTVEDFVPIACEYLTGPSYHLSARDRERLDGVLGEDHGRVVVGFFRSHTRKDLFLDDADLDLANHYFADPRQVFLLIKPFATRPSLGGFFFWEDGKIPREKTYREFLFSRSELGGGGPSGSEPVREPEPAPARPVRPQSLAGANAAAPPLPPDEQPLQGHFPTEDEYDRRARQRQMMERARAARPGPMAVPPPEGRLEDLTAAPLPAPPPRAGSLLSPPQEPARRSSAWLAVPVLLALGGAAYVVWDWSRVAPPQVTPPMASALPLKLAVQDRNGQLDIGWNTNAPAIQSAVRGVLLIEDGTAQREIELTASQLRNDRVYYSRVSGEVGLRLEVFANERSSVAESVRFVGAAPAAAVPEVAPPVEEVPATPPEQPPPARKARRTTARVLSPKAVPNQAREPEAREATPPPAPAVTEPEPEPPAREVPRPTRRR